MAVEQGVSISIGGGLDKTSSSYELFKTPGSATRLKNFEASMEGGYRRINGYRKFLKSPITSFSIAEGGAGYAAGTTVNIVDPEGNGTGATASATINNGAITALSITNAGSGYEIPPTVTFSNTGTLSVVAQVTATINTPTTPTGGTTPINGLFSHNEGFWAFQNGHIFWTEDGYTWIQVNKDYGTPSSGSTTTQQTTEEANQTWTAAWATAAQLSSKPTVALNTTARYQFSEYIPTGVPDARITCTNGADPVAYVETRLVSGVRYFKFHRALYTAYGLSKSTPVFANIPKPQYTTVHEDHTVLGAWSDKPETLYYSSRYSDIDFTGSSAGSINIGDKISGIKTFRDQIIIFGVNSISRLINISSNSTIAMEDITKNIGCLDGFSIAEIGGDLVFLAPDGIRTVAATARIDDIELSSISHKILPVISNIVNNLGSFDLSTTVIRTQNQYRLFYCKNTIGTVSQKGIIGTFKISPQGLPVWEWSETQGIEVASMASGFDIADTEITHHGDYRGFVHFHNKGDNFNGAKISAEFKTPDIDYGDIGIRKTLHFTKLSIKPEGVTDINLDVRYDFEDSAVSQPSSFLVGSILEPSLFGTALFGTSKFGTPEVPMKRINLLGSGFSNSFKFTSNDTLPPYSIQGMYVDLIPSSRR
tara:strand:+ start:677 stop:2626 length:1950 start_codon:yes stop_codon:yes gene_type:complete